MKYFTLKELTKSSTAIRYKVDNTPSKEQKTNLITLVDKILDPLREAYGKPIIVNSGFRNPKVNSLVGGSKSSQHMSGQAADIQTVPDTKEENKKLFELIQKLNLPFDQLINESDYSWVHVSYSPLNRRIVKHVR